jgi:hypothetical protein
MTGERGDKRGEQAGKLEALQNFVGGLALTPPLTMRDK